jgi:hypothetical protein
MAAASASETSVSSYQTRQHGAAQQKTAIYPFAAVIT